MVTLSLDLGAETEARLAEYAAQCGTDVSAALRDAVHEAVRQLLTANLDDAAETYRPLGDPNEETLAAMAELKNGGGKSFATFEELMADLHADDYTQHPIPTRLPSD
ncbi:MAG: hypothetical protein QM537_04785 [Candidatus Symbiobacter sp.]|nr:hypothetical protein [Candidatus Symbiobacter sp.]